MIGCTATEQLKSTRRTHYTVKSCNFIIGCLWQNDDSSAYINGFKFTDLQLYLNMCMSPKKIIDKWTSVISN